MNGLRRSVVRLCICTLSLWANIALAEDPPAAIGAVLTSSHSLPAAPRYQLAIVVDDLGYSRSRDQRAVALPANMTVAVLPQSPWASDIAQLASSAGKEVILHQPMQTISGLHRGDPGDLRQGMTGAEVGSTLGSNLNAVPGSVGINNHRGSLLTAQQDAMDQLMQQLRTRGLYFLDSRTTAATVAHETARQWGVPTVKRDVFLDHVRTPAALDHEFKRALGIARRQGYAVLIAHPHPASMDYLATALTTLPRDIETVTLSELIQRTSALRP